MGEISQRAKHVKISPIGQKDASSHGLVLIPKVFLLHIGIFGGST